MLGLAELARRRSPDCRQATAMLPALAAGEVAPHAAEREHVAQCLRCQAEVAAYRRILRTLHALRDDRIAPPPGALAAVLAALEAGATAGHGPGASRAMWVAYAGGITVATAAAGAAGILVWMNRRRPGGLADAV